jgi:phosphodiesterase/alkaline phosphatase D-like protein
METSGRVKCPFCGSSKVEFVAMFTYQCSEYGKEFRAIAARVKENFLFFWVCSGDQRASSFSARRYNENLGLGMT